MEIKADVIMKATKVEGIYDCDPVKDGNAKMFDTITFTDVLKLGLRVMDATAISLCRENNLPIVIFNLNTQGQYPAGVPGRKDRLDCDGLRCADRGICAESATQMRSRSTSGAAQALVTGFSQGAGFGRVARHWRQ